MGRIKPILKAKGFISITLCKDDLERLRRDASKSTCRTVTAYCRKLLLGKPVRVFYRNQSFDSFIEEAIALRKEMELLRKLGTFTPAIVERIIFLQEEIKRTINKIFDHVRKNKPCSENSGNPPI